LYTMFTQCQGNIPKNVHRNGNSVDINRCALLNPKVMGESGETLGQLVARRLEEKQMSQSRLAKILGIDAQAIRNLLNQRTKTLRDASHDAIAEALDVPIAEIVAAVKNSKDGDSDGDSLQASAIPRKTIDVIAQMLVEGKLSRARKMIQDLQRPVKLEGLPEKDSVPTGGQRAVRQAANKRRKNDQEE
jgi:transcriptional regulator with XRE-family HTH domain